MAEPRKLYRRSSAGRIAGVCAGVAEYFDSDVTLIRLLWIVLSIVPGGIIGGFISYVVAWVIVPDAGGSMAEPATRRLTRSTTNRDLGGVCGGLAEYFGVDATVVRLGWAILTVVPGCIVFGVLAYLVAWFIMPRQPLAQTASGSSAGMSGIADAAQ
jgi:phage shock protein PspC (stress-responsive transcriptional regulator)